MNIGDTVSGTVEKLIFSGKGILRKDSIVIFVDDVIEGEDVEVVIREKRRNFFIADLKKVLTKDPNRIHPLCPVYGVCGGCSLQHMQYEKGVQEKSKWLQESLERIGKVELPTPPSVKAANPIWAYRRKIKLHFLVQDGEIQLGFFSKDNKTLVPIDYCPIFNNKNDGLFEQVRTFLRPLVQPDEKEGEVSLLKLEDGTILFSYKDTHSIDTKNLSLQINDLTFFFSPDVFLQNHPNVSLTIYNDVVQIVEKIAPKKPVFDLYSGIGILSLLLAKKGHTVHAVESNRVATEQAQKSAAFNKIQNATFSAESVEKFLKKTKNRADVWIINPPRTGISQEVIDQIRTKKPQFLIYISCNPTTLARDMKALEYSMVSIQGYDMFPQTTHFETVALLKRPDRAMALHG